MSIGREGEEEGCRIDEKNVPRTPRSRRRAHRIRGIGIIITFAVIIVAKRRGWIGDPAGRGSHEELLEEVLGKQVLQIVVHALVLVRWAGLAHAEDRQAEVLHLDARLGGGGDGGGRPPPRVVAALRVPVTLRAPMTMMMTKRTRGLGLVRSPIRSTDTDFRHRN